MKKVESPMPVIPDIVLERWWQYIGLQRSATWPKTCYKLLHTGITASTWTCKPVMFQGMPCWYWPVTRPKQLPIVRARLALAGSTAPRLLHCVISHTMGDRESSDAGINIKSEQTEDGVTDCKSFYPHPPSEV